MVSFMINAWQTLKQQDHFNITAPRTKETHSHRPNVVRIADTEALTLPLDALSPPIKVKTIAGIRAEDGIVEFRSVAHPECIYIGEMRVNEQTISFWGREFKVKTSAKITITEFQCRKPEFVVGFIFGAPHINPHALCTSISLVGSGATIPHSSELTLNFCGDPGIRLPSGPKIQT
jgi:hypothetical protein